VVWCQEEPKNMGAWFFVQERIHEVLRMDQRFWYVGRPSAASPATGSAKIHDTEQQTLLHDAFRVKD